MGRILFLLLLAAVAVGCGAKTPEPANAPLDQAPADGQLTGTVLEHLNASPYVYLRIKTPKGEVWAAVPGAPIEDGASVTVVNAMRMTGFESEALKRTFDEVYFGTLASPEVAANGAGGDPHAGIQSAASVDVGQVEKATGADARTVAEVWAERASLAGRTVTIRGVVVKYNAGVMGKNWIHLQDGSGDGAQGTNDITVTSQDEAAKGQTVTIKGTVRTNQDFGAGYTYAVLIEDAKVARE